MNPVRHGHPTVRRFVRAALIAGTAMVLSTAAVAGQCPADKVGMNTLSAAPTAPQGVSDSVLSEGAEEVSLVGASVVSTTELDTAPGSSTLSSPGSPAVGVITWVHAAIASARPATAPSPLTPERLSPMNERV